MRSVGWVNLTLAVAWPALALLTLVLSVRFTYAIIVLVLEFSQRTSAIRQPSTSSNYAAEPSTPGSLGSSISSPNVLDAGANESIPKQRNRNSSSRSSTPSSYNLRNGLTVTAVSAVFFTLAILLRLVVSVIFSVLVFLRQPPDRRVDKLDTRDLFTRGLSRFPFVLSNLAQAVGIVTLLIVCFERCRSTFARTQYRISPSSVRWFYGATLVGLINILVAILFSSLGLRKEAVIIASLTLVIYPSISFWIVWRFQSNTWHLSRRMLSMVTLTQSSSLQSAMKKPKNQQSSNDAANVGGITPTPTTSSPLTINIISPTTGDGNGSNIPSDPSVSPGIVSEIVPSKLKLAKSVSGSRLPSSKESKSSDIVSPGSSEEKTFSPPAPITLPRSPSPEIRRRASSNRRSLYRISSLMETSLRLTIVGTVAILSTLIMLAVTIVNITQSNPFLSIIEVIVSHLDLCLNTFALLTTFQEYQHWYNRVFGSLHDCIFTRLKF